MNPNDYLTPEADALDAGEGKRKREEGGESEGIEPGTKRLATHAGPVPEVAPGSGEALAPGVTQRRVLAPNRKAMDPPTAVDLSQGQWAPAAAAARGESEPAPPPGAADGPPPLASWFRPDVVHDLEREHFADYLAIPPPTPEGAAAGAGPSPETVQGNISRFIYLRNAMIQAYRCVCVGGGGGAGGGACAAQGGE